MIAGIKGEIWSISEDSLIIGVSGLGLRVFIPAALRAESKVGEKIHLHTHLVVREDLLSLYGFEREEDCEFFEMLLGVNGVGPRIALGILSTLSVDAIRRAIVNEQSEVFSRVPGVGKRTAQKIQIHLQGKVGEESVWRQAPSELTADAQIIEALTGLGYSIVEAQAALQSIPRETPDDMETRLRAALHYFAG